MPDSPEKQNEPSKIGRRAFLAGGIGILAATAVGLLPRFLMGEARKEALPAGASPDNTPTPGQPIPESTSQPSPTAPPPTETPSPTATSTETATPTPTPTPDIPKPAYEKTFPTGAVERYDMVTEKNFDRYFAKVSKVEFEQLVKEQPDLPLFPFLPLSDKFSIGEFTVPAIDGPLNRIKVYSDHLMVIALSDGEVSLIQDPRTKKYIKLMHKERKSEQIVNNYGYSVAGENSTLTPKIDAPLWSGPDSRGKPVKKGELIGEFFGADPFETSSGYTGSANQIDLGIEKLEKLSEPVVTKEPDGGILTRVNKVTNITPSLTDPNNWVHTRDGKIAIAVP